MFEYIKGKIEELGPTHVVIDNQGIGYFIHISLQTYTLLAEKESSKVYISEIIREDDHILYGFFEKHEREIFVKLTSVSGIGANTGRMILSSLTLREIEEAIATSNVNVLKSIKGIGLKTAQRLIIELKDKITKQSDAQEIFVPQNNTIKDEALSALVMLGFNRANATKAIDKILVSPGEITIESVVKQALKML